MNAQSRTQLDAINATYAYDVYMQKKEDMWNDVPIALVHDAVVCKRVWWHGIGRYILAIVVTIVAYVCIENSIFNHYKRNIWNNIYANTITQEEGMRQLVSLYHEYNK